MTTKGVEEWRFRGLSFNQLGQEQLNQTNAWLEKATTLRDQLQQIVAHDSKVKKTNCEVQWKAWNFQVFEPLAQAILDHKILMEDNEHRWQLLTQYELFLRKADRDACVLYLEPYCKETYDPFTFRDYPPFTRVVAPPSCRRDPMLTWKRQRDEELNVWDVYPKQKRRTPRNNNNNFDAYVNPFKLCVSNKSYYLPFYTRSSSPEKNLFCPGQLAANSAKNS